MKKFCNVKKKVLEFFIAIYIHVFFLSLWVSALIFNTFCYNHYFYMFFYEKPVPYLKLFCVVLFSVTFKVYHLLLLFFDDINLIYAS